MVSAEDQMLAGIIGFSGLLIGEVRSICLTFFEMISRPFPKFNKYLGMTKVEHDQHVLSHNRKQWLGLTKIVLLISFVVVEVWVVYAGVTGKEAILEWVSNRGGVSAQLLECTCCWGLIMFVFLLQERFPNWFQD